MNFNNENTVYILKIFFFLRQSVNTFYRVFHRETVVKKCPLHTFNMAVEMQIIL